MSESDNTGVLREPCTVFEMNAALDPYDEFVDIREDQNYSLWHGTAGLACIACGHPVTVYPSKIGNRFVRHGIGGAAVRGSPEAKAARESFLHYRFKYWVRDQLRVCGADDAEVERGIEGRRRPDVFAVVNGTTLAVEVQHYKLDYVLAELRTRELRRGGFDRVLWLTRHCDWVERLPTLGIESFDPSGADYRAHTGFLTMNPGRGLAVTEYSVSAMLRGWLADELAWAYRDHKTAGWATVQDWEQHTKHQADIIENQRRQLTTATKLRDQYRTALTTQRQELDRIGRDLEQQAGTVSDQQQRIADQQQQIAAAANRIRTDTEALTAARDEIDKTEQQRDSEQRARRKNGERIRELEAQLAAVMRALTTRTQLLKALALVYLVLAVLVWLT